MVGEPLRVRQHGHLFAVAAQVVQDPARLRATPVPTTSIRTLASIGRRVEAVLAHDDWAGVAGRIDGQQHVVAEELGGDHRSNAVELFTVRNHRRNKLFGPQHERGGSVGGRSLHRYAAESAVRDSRCDSAVKRNAVAEEFGGETVGGVPVDLLRATDLGETPVAHDRHLIRDRQRLFLVVSHQ